MPLQPPTEMFRLVMTIIIDDRNNPFRTTILHTITCSMNPFLFVSKSDAAADISWAVARETRAARTTSFIIIASRFLVTVVDS